MTVVGAVAGVESEASTAGGVVASVRRRPVSSANLLVRLLAVEALACLRYSTETRTVPMAVLAFLTDPKVVVKIFRLLGLPISAPASAPAQAPQPELGFTLVGDDAGSGEAKSDADPDLRTPSDRTPP